MLNHHLPHCRSARSLRGGWGTFPRFKKAYQRHSLRQRLAKRLTVPPVSCLPSSCLKPAAAMPNGKLRMENDVKDDDQQILVAEGCS